VETLDVNGIVRSYLLHLPKEPAGRPLIIALHPLGSNPKLMEAMTGFSGIAVREDLIVAYPEGTKATENGLRSWNARFCCRDAMGMNADDVGFLSALIDHLTERYEVNGVLVTGFSNGGMLAHLAGVELSHKLTAVAPVAATIGRAITEMKPRRELPVLIIHGTDDHLLPLEGRESGRLLPVYEAVDYWVRADQCSEAPMTEERDGVEVMRYCPYLGGAEVVFIRVKDAGHVWPGSRVHMRSENDPRTLDASAVIWKFFRSHLR
jgi:polyhydroxybutyrate depolymerase